MDNINEVTLTILDYYSKEKDINNRYISSDILSIKLKQKELDELLINTKKRLSDIKVGLINEQRRSNNYLGVIQRRIGNSSKKYEVRIYASMIETITKKIKYIDSKLQLIDAYLENGLRMLNEDDQIELSDNSRLLEASEPQVVRRVA